MSEARKEQGGKSLRRFKPYPANKDSNVEWLGEIPAHWKVTVLKRIGDLQAGAGFPDDEQGVMTEGIPFFKVGDMGSAGNEREMVEWQHTVSEATARRLRAFVFPARTIVFAKVGAALMLNRRRLLSRPSCIDNNMMGFLPGDCDLTWALYWLSGLDMGELANPGAVPSVNEGQIRGTPVVVPPRDEQHAIAAFLDRETARIDALVAKKERLIELLQEKRTALITRAVTKGLDPNVPMKDSGVEWLGEIPAHWHLRKLKHVCERVFVGVAEAATFAYVDDGVPMLRSTDVRANRIRTDDIRRIDRRFADRLPSKQLRTSDIVTVRTGNAGVSAVVPPEYDGGQCFTLVVSRPIGGHDSRYLCYWLNALPGQQQFAVEGMGTAQINISVPIVQNIIVCVPPPEEQERVANWIEQEVARWDALMMKVREATDRLKELRTALISAAVTGKIDVREEAA